MNVVKFFACQPSIMRYFVLNLLTVFVLSPFIFEIEEASPNRPKRIVSYSGKLADLSEYPFIVSIWTLQDENFTINGALLSLDWVVTTYSAILRLENFTKNSQYYASPGPRDNTTQVAVKSIYNYTTTIDYIKPVNDLSLVKLSDSFKESSTVKPVKLPPDKNYYYDKCLNVYAIGSGSARYSKKQIDNRLIDDLNDEHTFYTDFHGSIRVVKFEIISPEKSLSSYIKNPAFQKPMTPLVCQNDSGQPLICGVFGTVDGVLGGLISGRKGCGSTTRATPIILYMTWINKITGLKVPFQSTPEDVNKTSTTTGSSDADGKTTGSGRDASKRGLTIDTTGDDVSEMDTSKMSQTKISKFIVILCIIISRMF